LRGSSIQPAPGTLAPHVEACWGHANSARVYARSLST
jgi:hypothetical protein